MMESGKLAPRARFELATLRLTAEEIKNLSVLSGVAYRKFGAILTSLVAPNSAPKWTGRLRVESSYGGGNSGSGGRNAGSPVSDPPSHMPTWPIALAMPFRDNGRP